jgi:hypothetical protein
MDTLVWNAIKMENLRVSQLRWHEDTKEDLPYDGEEIRSLREKLFVNDDDRMRAPHVVYDNNQVELMELMECLYDPIGFSRHLDVFNSRDTGYQPLELTEIQESIIMGHLLNKYTIISQPRQMGVSTAIRVIALFESMCHNRSVTILTHNEANSLHQYDLTLDMYSSIPYHLKQGILPLTPGRKIRFENGAQIFFSTFSRLAGHTPDTLLVDNINARSHNSLLNMVITMQCRIGSRIMICDTGMEHEITESVYRNLMNGIETKFTFGTYECEWERVDPDTPE